MFYPSKSTRSARRAIAGLAGVAIALSGVVSITPSAFAQETTSSCVSFVSKNIPRGNGALEIKEKKNYKPGDHITVVGTGFDNRPAQNPILAALINDGAIQWEDNQLPGVEFDPRNSFIVDPNLLPMNDGSFEFTMVLPKTLNKPGQYLMRVLGGSHDGGPQVSQSAFFNVITDDSQAGDCGTYPGAETEDGSTVATISGAPSTAANGSVSAVVSLSGFTPGAVISAKVDGVDAAFREGRRDTAPTKNVNADGTFTETVVLPAGSAPAGKHTITFISDKDEDQDASVEITTNPGVSLSDETLYLSVPEGEELTMTISNLPEGAVVKSINAEGKTLSKGEVSATDGSAAVDIAVPVDSTLLSKPITVVYSAGGEDRTFDTGLTVSASRSALNEDKFNIKHVKVPTGQYQTAINTNTGFGFGTSAVGRPPITDSQLYKFDAETLEIVDKAVPAEAPNGGLYAVYGVGLDNANNNVWVTNTRQNTVAVYKQDTLELVKQFPDGEVQHSRDVVVDTQTNRAYVSVAERGMPTVSEIEVFDTKTLEPLGVIDIAAAYPGTRGVIMSLVFDEKTGELFTTNMAGQNAFKIDTRKIKNEDFTKEAVGNDRTTRTDNSAKYRDAITVYDLGDVSEPSGTAWNPNKRQLFIASQGTDDVVVVDVDKKNVIKRIPTGGRALNASYDPVSNMVYVINRSGGNVTVIDAESLEIKASLTAGKYANHLAVGKDGYVYSVNKAGNEEDGKRYDDMYRYQLKEMPPSPNPSDNNGSSNPGSSDGKGSSDITGKLSSEGSSTEKAIKGTLGALGILGVLVGIFNFLLNQNIIKPSQLPDFVRNFLRI